jgi:hypothetical protein
VAETDFRVSAATQEGTKAAGSGFGAEPEDQACIVQTWNHRRGWHNLSAFVGSILADMGEHQLTICDYLRHGNLNVTNQYLQATAKTKRLAQKNFVAAILPTGSLSRRRSMLIQ